MWYRFSQFAFRTIFRLYLRARILDADQMPPKGAVILACNHLSFLDPPFVGSSAQRPICYFARKSLFRNPIAAAILRSWHVVPVDRERGDVAGLKMILGLLEDGKAVLMFPEGTRQEGGQLGTAQNGFGWLVVKSGAPVLPLRVWGTDTAMPRGVTFPRPRQITLRFGLLMRFDAQIAAARGQHGEAAKEIFRQIGSEVMKTIAQLQSCKE